ncbi:MAG: hypothetical protein K0R73_1351 [Candidatus Midichloriaceae bacterium]|jgi:hypothetical protein|nr:hypothetical protein [Candidatus Midichloriaceae bacterium]
MKKRGDCYISAVTRGWATFWLSGMVLDRISLFLLDKKEYPAIFEFVAGHGPMTAVGYVSTLAGAGALAAYSSKFSWSCAIAYGAFSAYKSATYDLNGQWGVYEFIGSMHSNVFSLGCLALNFAAMAHDRLYHSECGNKNASF